MIAVMTEGEQVDVVSSCIIVVHLMNATRVLRLKTSFPPASTRHKKKMKCRNFKDGGRNENSRNWHALLCDKSGTKPSIKKYHALSNHTTAQLVSGRFVCAEKTSASEWHHSLL